MQDFVTVDGIKTRYKVVGSGPALLMFSPGGFDSSMDTWATHGVYRSLNLLEHLSRSYTCITFDRRESGQAGGRVERIGWDHYIRQAKGLLDHLGVAQAHLMGGCVGCSTVAAFSVKHPGAVLSMVLYSPAGGVKYRMKQHERISRHLAYVSEHGLGGVAELAHSHRKGFSDDPRVGPWAPVIRSDPAFAADYVDFDQDRYATVVTGMGRLLFDRDTVPGPEPEDLLCLDIPALVVPGQDQSHTTSAARYLHECLPNADYWDVPVADQTEEAATKKILAFLDAAGSGRLG